MQLGKFSLDFTKDLFTKTVVQQWINLPRVITRGLVLLVDFDLAMKSGSWPVIDCAIILCLTSTSNQHSANKKLKGKLEERNMMYPNS